MHERKKIPYILSCVLLCAALLGGCGVTETAPDPEKAGVTELSMVLEANEFYLLSGYDDLKVLDLSGSTCYDEILTWAKRHPEVEVRYTVRLPDDSEIAHDAQTLDLSALKEREILSAASLFEYLPELKTVELGSEKQVARSPELVQQLRAGRPDLRFTYSFLLGDSLVSLDETALDLRAPAPEEGGEETEPAADLSALLPWLPCMTQLSQVELGEGDAENGALSWADIAALEAAAPQARVDYAFTLYKEHFTLQDTEMNLNHIDIADQGALVKAITACMPNLNYLDMDFCGVDDEHMAEIRDALPNATVVWRIWFGRSYTARTDTERILASNPDRGGMLTKENTASLKYCTKVKYLDVGHNLDLEDISFVSYMPDLEIAVLAMNQWWDARPLLNCPKLEYLEMQTGACSDLRPIAQLKNLKHLNICYCLALTDMSPIYDLDLERLWVGSISPIPIEQVEEYHRRHPLCEINTTTVDPTLEGWRYKGWDQFGIPIIDPYYQKLRDVFGYNEMQTTYNYIENDPKYFKGGWGWW